MICPTLYLTDDNLFEIVDEYKELQLTGTGIGLDFTKASKYTIDEFYKLTAN